MPSKKPTNVVSITLGELANDCFVIMPFNSIADRVYEVVFKNAIRGAKLNPLRADEIYGDKRVMSDVWRALRSSRLVVAEVTGKNANVLYELGMAHALGKPVIIVTGQREDVPFDLRDIRYIVYDKNQPDWGQRLEETLKKTLQKLLTTEGPETLLEDIDVATSFPRLQEPVEAEAPSQPQKDLSGTWRIVETYDGGITNGTLHLMQNGRELSGQLVLVDQPDGEEEFMVQMGISGVVTGSKVTFAATDYQILRGYSPGYELDQWYGEILDDETIEGNTMDSGGVAGEFRLNREAAPA